MFRELDESIAFGADSSLKRRVVGRGRSFIAF